MAKISKLMMLLLILLAICVFSRPAKAETSVYMFSSDQSIAVKTGGFVGLHKTYSIDGQFQLTVDSDAGVASFEMVDANLTDEAGSEYGRNLDEIFNITGLSGTIIDETTIEFEGKTADGTESDVSLRLNFRDASAHITGKTTPPPNSADMFFYDVNAVAIQKYAGGSGTSDDPYKINKPQNLIDLADSEGDLDACFVLCAHLDLDQMDVGNYLIPVFDGVFDGNGLTISNLTITSSVGGLFGEIRETGQVMNLAVVEANIIHSGGYVGILAGENSGNIRKCRTTGCVQGNNGWFGGVVGRNSGVISYCTSAADVTSKKPYPWAQIGGLVGFNIGIVEHCRSTGQVIDKGTGNAGGLVGRNESTISLSWSTSMVRGGDKVGGLVGQNYGGLVNNCYCTGNVHGEGLSSGSVGGLIGENTGFVRNCYCKGDVSSVSDLDIGGLVGTHTRGGGGVISNCYSIGRVPSGENDRVGGLVGGDNIGLVHASFYDINNSGKPQRPGETGYSTDEMFQTSLYLNSGWDLVGETANGSSDIWFKPNEGEYPMLSIFSDYVPPKLTGKGTIDDPYLIHDANELGTVYYRPEACYRLEKEIDLTGMKWSSPVIPVFCGVFDGNGFAIKNLKMSGAGYLGFLGRTTSGACIRNLEVLGADITGDSALGYHDGTVENVAMLVAENYGSISNCYSQGEVTYEPHPGNHFWNFAGLVAMNHGTVTYCHSNSNIRAEEWCNHIGGLVALNKGALRNNLWVKIEGIAFGEAV